MTDIQNAMTLLVGAFNKYAGVEGDNNTLSNTELKALLQNEFGNLQRKASDQAGMDRLFEGLDANKDNSVDFKEFVAMVTRLTVMCQAHFSKK